LKAFKSRGNLLRNYDKRYLTNNEMPHKWRWNTQWILWRLGTYIEWDSDIAREFKWLVDNDFREYNILRGASDKTSVSREHWHIYR
jgi:hypothetical protein